jgi:hypothetical protein
VQKAKNIPKAKLPYQKGVEKEIAAYRNKKYKNHFKQQLGKLIDLCNEIQASTYGFLNEFTWGYGVAQSVTYKLKNLTLLAK